MTQQEDSFFSHLVELRDRLLRALIAVGIVFLGLCLWPGPGAIYDILALPLTKALPEGTKMVAIGVITPFMVPIKVTMLIAFVIALPVVLYQIWAFVAPGLYRHEGGEVRITRTEGEVGGYGYRWLVRDERTEREDYRDLLDDAKTLGSEWARGRART
jgi:Sec-independent protein secretion pathway component TatC